MSEITVQSIHKAFKGQPVLRSLSLEVNDRELCVLLGPSGCGKTTLLRIIAGLETADGGAVSIGGRRVDHLPPQQRNMAMVFQNYAVFPHMTIGENIAFGLRMKKASEAVIGQRVQSSAGGLETRAMVIEMLGASLQITAKAGDGLIRISVPADQPVSSGQIFGLTVKAGKCRWYDERDQLIV